VSGRLFFYTKGRILKPGTELSCAQLMDALINRKGHFGPAPDRGGPSSERTDQTFLPGRRQKATIFRSRSYAKDWGSLGKQDLRA
jgi:hypothetical protein